MQNIKKKILVIIGVTIAIAIIPTLIVLVSSGMFSTIGIPTLIFIVVMIALITGLMYLKFKSFKKIFSEKGFDFGKGFGFDAFDNMTKPKTLDNGVPATATVISCRQGNTKTSYGVLETYQLVIEVNVSNPQGETWTATMTEMIPLTQIAVFQPGVTFSVLYDPNDKSKVVIEQNSGGSQANNTTGNSMDIPGYGTVNSQMANEAKKAAPQDITLLVMSSSALVKELGTTGVSAIGTIISNYLLYENYMNGTDVYQLKLNVIAIDRSQFEADVTFLIGKSSLFKIEPGKTVFVKYDQNNTHRICVTGLDKENSGVEL